MTLTPNVSERSTVTTEPRRTPVYALTIPDDAWVANSGLDNDPEACLFATLVLNDDLYLHVEAWAVTYADEGDRIGTVQRAAHDLYEDNFGDLHAAVGADGHFDTLTIKGREYIVLASPFC